MEKRQRFGALKAQVFVGILLLASFVGRVSSLSVTVTDVECVYEYVLYEGDSISGNFVVVDHEIFWSSDHPGIDFTVSHQTFYLFGLGAFVQGFKSVKSGFLFSLLISCLELF